MSQSGQRLFLYVCIHIMYYTILVHVVYICVCSITFIQYMKQLELCSFWLHGIIVPSFLFTRKVSGEGNKRKHPTSFFNQFPIVSLPHPIHCDVLASSVRTGAYTLTATVGYLLVVFFFFFFLLLLLLWWYKLINGFWMRGLALHYDDITDVYLYMIQREKGE